MVRNDFSIVTLNHQCNSFKNELPSHMSDTTETTYCL